jgi:hypothetical protein
VRALQLLVTVSVSDMVESTSLLLPSEKDFGLLNIEEAMLKEE